jgi:hypothetical protein
VALHQPARDLGVEYDPEAVDVIGAYTEGYPYFLQEYGKTVWGPGRRRPTDFSKRRRGNDARRRGQARRELLLRACRAHNGP